MTLAKKNFAFLIPAPQTSLILLASCPMRERFLGAIPKSDRAKAGRTGALRDGRWPGGLGGALGGAAPCLGRARSHLAARGGFTPRLKGAHWCPGASHRSIPSRGSRGTGKPRTLCAARTRKLGCLKFESQVSCPGRDAARSPCEALLRRTGTVPNSGVLYGPGSAALRSARATRCVRGPDASEPKGTF
jgi:hypothetical protein